MWLFKLDNIEWGGVRWWWGGLFISMPLHTVGLTITHKSHSTDFHGNIH